MKTRSMADWLEALHREGVPAGPINDIGQAFAEDQARFRDLATEIEDDRGVAVPIVRSPLRLSETPPVLHTAPPRVGQHTSEILTDVLGLGDEAIRDLDVRGVISLSESARD